MATKKTIENRSGKKAGGKIRLQADLHVEKGKVQKEESK